MKAIILVGGYGTRLRPLTFSCPKSILPFANKPMIEHQIEALAQVGCQEIILAINYQADKIEKGLKELSEKYKVKIVTSRETTALGTAGPIRFAKDLLGDCQQLFVLNSDIICDYPLKQLLDVHKAHGKEGTIVLATVQHPERFGVVVVGENGRITSFVEKPKNFVSNKVNAGIYLFNTSMIKRIPEGFVMIETGVFPKMAADGELYSLCLEGDNWNDVGQPEDYLIGQGKYLAHHQAECAKGSQYEGCVLVHPSAKVSEKARVGPNVVIGANCVVEEGVWIKNSTIFHDTVLHRNSFVDHSIISWKCDIGDWGRVEGLTVIGENVKVNNEVRITAARIMSQKEVKENVEHGTIMM